VNEKHNERDAKNNDGGKEAEELERSGDVVESIGQFGSLFASIKLRIFDATSGVLADDADEDLADSASDVRVSIEEGVVIDVLGDACVVLRAVKLLLSVGVARLGLSNREVGRGEDEAVSGDLVTRLELDDVTDNEVPGRDGLHLAALAADNGEAFLTVEVLELHEFLVLSEVLPGGDEDLDDQSDEDENAFNPADGRIDDHTRDDADHGKESHEQQDTVVKSILDRVKEGRPLWARLLVFGVLVLASTQVGLVAHDTAVGVGLHLVQDSGSAALAIEALKAAVLVVGTTEHGLELSGADFEDGGCLVPRD
jgi:hypothetical protein